MANTSSPDILASLRFAVLQHLAIDQPHFDLLVDTDGVSLLATWRCDVWPITLPTVLKRQADHRRVYLDYQGEISGNRGRVKRVASGNCRVTMRSQEHWLIDCGEGLPLLELKHLHDDVWEALPCDTSSPPSAA